MARVTSFYAARARVKLTSRSFAHRKGNYLGSMAGECAPVVSLSSHRATYRYPYNFLSVKLSELLKRDHSAHIDPDDMKV